MPSKNKIDTKPLESAKLPDLDVKVTGMDMAKVLLNKAMVLLQAEVGLPRPVGQRDLVRAYDHLQYACFLLALADDREARYELPFMRMTVDASIEQRVLDEEKTSG